MPRGVRSRRSRQVRYQPRRGTCLSWRRESGSACLLFLKFGIGHITLWGHWVRSTDALLLLLHVLLIGHLLLLLWSDEVLWDPSAPTTGHICLWGGNLLMAHVFGRLGTLVGIDAVLIARCRLRGVQAGL